LGVILCWPESQFLVQARQEDEPLFIADPQITTGFLFSRLQMRFEQGVSKIFASQRAREDAGGCYIDFSGFSASRVILAQDKFFEHNLCDRRHLGASKTKTPATAGLAATFKRRQPSRDRIHGADI
jgi:hypothetical protein